MVAYIWACCWCLDSLSIRSSGTHFSACTPHDYINPVNYNNFLNGIQLQSTRLSGAYEFVCVSFVQLDKVVSSLLWYEMFMQSLEDPIIHHVLCQISTVQPLTFGNGQVISFHTFLGMWLLIQAGKLSMLVIESPWPKAHGPKMAKLYSSMWRH